VLICLSPALLREYEAVSQREKFRGIPHFSARAVKLIQAIKAIALYVEPTERIDFIADEPDNRVLEAAFAARARVIVTGNSNDFSFSAFRGILIQTPREFYEEFFGV
jgi:uncharacterized protein